MQSPLLLGGRRIDAVADNDGSEELRRIGNFRKRGPAVPRFAYIIAESCSQRVIQVPRLIEPNPMNATQRV